MLFTLFAPCLCLPERLLIIAQQGLPIVYCSIPPSSFTPTDPTMGNRTKVSKRRREDLDEVDLAAFATNWPRVKRNCTTGPKNYIDLCSESEDGEKQEDNIPRGSEMTYIRATGNKKRKYDYNDGNMAIDEDRSTPPPGPQAPAVPKSKHETKSNHRILRLTLSQYAQRKLRAGCLFKELPLEVCCLFIL